jgi:hypothetical protein
MLRGIFRTATRRRKISDDDVLRVIASRMWRASGRRDLHTKLSGNTVIFFLL